ARWVAKAHESALAGAIVVALLPARTCSRWWHSYVAEAAEIHFLRDRLRFGNARNVTSCAPFPSAIAIFRPPRVATLANRTQKSKKSQNPVISSQSPEFTHMDLF